MEMIAELPPFGEEQALVEIFSEIAGSQYAFLRTTSHMYAQSNRYIKILAVKLSPFLPDYRREFEASPKYEVYRNWIKQILLERIPDPSVKRILQLSDKSEISNLTPENKHLRAKFSDAVSGVLRKLKKHVYKDDKHYKRCFLCGYEVKLLLVTCVNCMAHFHYRCLRANRRKCSRCLTSFVKESTISLCITDRPNPQGHYADSNATLFSS
jgi:hypothetical protein